MLAQAAVDAAPSNVMPYVCLVVGMVVVLGMILVLKANAFLSLICAAIAVSLLAPGETGEKISRVAAAFGSAAGGIGIVIASAAIIGLCLMESGAADRIVQGFVSLLGEKRAPWALMGSGFTLSVPVFFDTVFYLLVPLARSLYRKTEKNYLLYLCAIAAGGAITHTLVPPTPGPLFMAANMNINIGLMIVVGALVALPAGVVGVLASVLLDKFFPVPFREVASTDELADPDGPAEEAAAGGTALPSLGLSLLPVVLPVLMISVNTVVETFQSGQRNAAYQAMNEVEQAAFPDVKDRVNIPTSLDGLHDYTAIIGNPSLALLVACGISMWLLVKTRGLTLDRLGDRVEEALMSGGVIILITAAGGAFGAMLKVAGIGDEIAKIAEENQLAGVALLLMAWGVAALMKVAQGSSTTAMITVSGIFGAAFAGAEGMASLGFHPVYLATAIGSGSLMGSWMNDSGFWIFTKMGGLTPKESLKSWTVLLGVLSVTSLLTTILLSTVLPMSG